MIVSISHNLMQDLQRIAESRFGDFVYVSAEEAKQIYEILKQHPDVIEILKVYNEGAE